MKNNPITTITRRVPINNMKKINRTHLIETTADKGNILVILHKEDYNNKIDKSITQNNFTKIPHSITNNNKA
jgi:hypothetical protein